MRSATVFVAVVAGSFLIPIVGCTAGGGAFPCENGFQDEGETGVDCGGSCGLCAGEACTTSSSCASRRCEQDVCAAATCSDGVRNGTELGIDCGGTCGACAGPVVGDACTNGLQDAGEDGVDCGGGCQPCAVASGCTDNVLGADESDVDCGGVCQACEVGRACGQAADCSSGVCTGGRCVEAAASCDNNVKDGDETDVDCGGSCLGCRRDQFCEADSDCRSVVCTLGLCADPSCEDERQNGSETDVDCGGSCGGCETGERCEEDDDCLSDDRCGEALVCELAPESVTVRNPLLAEDSNDETFAVFAALTESESYGLMRLEIGLQADGDGLPGPGIYDMSDVAANLRTCALCIFLGSLEGGGQVFHAREGSVTLHERTTSDGRALEISFSDIVLHEVSIDLDGRISATEDGTRLELVAEGRFYGEVQ